MSDVLRRNELQVWFIAEHVVDVPLIEMSSRSPSPAARRRDECGEHGSASRGSVDAQPRPTSRRRPSRKARSAPFVVSSSARR